MDLKLPNIPKLAHGAMDRLTAYDWPGNVRENIIERALILDRAGPFDFGNVLTNQPDHIVIDGPGEDELFPNLVEVMSRHIRQALEKANGRVHGPKGVAELLAINPSTLRSRMKKLGIKSPIDIFSYRLT